MLSHARNRNQREHDVPTGSRRSVLKIESVIDICIPDQSKVHLQHLSLHHVKKAARALVKRHAVFYLAHIQLIHDLPL